MNSLIGKIHNLSRLRWALLGFVVSLGAPAVVLVYYSLSELKWEAFHQQRTLAIELTERINFQINRWVQIEEQRAYSDYQFVVVSGDPTANYLQRSPLSAVKVADSLPGTLGYFQVAANGQFSSPSLPGSAVEAARYGISAGEYRQREAMRDQILQVLLDNQLLQTQIPRNQELTVQSGERADSYTSQSIRLRDQALSEQTVPDQTPLNKTTEEQSAPVTAVRGVGGDVASEIVSSSVRLTGNQNSLNQNSHNQNNDNRADEFKQANDNKQEGDNKQKDNDQVQTLATLAFDNLGQQQALRDTAIQEKKLLRELDLDSKLQEAVVKKKSELSYKSPAEYPRSPRKEQTLLPELSEARADSEEEISARPARPFGGSTPSVTMFESEIDPFEFSPLDSGHLVFFRKVWRDGERTIQGLVLDRELFLGRTIEQEYRETLLSTAADLVVAYRSNVMEIYRGNRSFTRRLTDQDISGDLLYQSRLAPPFNEIELLFSLTQLPDGPGAQVVRWSAIIMALVLGFGTWLLYRLGLRQMRLVQQQQDFVSAVSHELKTPLTSIRMYGEMLREGWADENKKRQYYDYIHDESERLSRLIANVLQLARMNRRELVVSLKSVSLAELVDNLRSKLVSQIERSGFTFDIDWQPELATTHVMVDIDSFLQILINLVDNALKFSAKSTTKKIVLRIALAKQGEVVFAIRDFGPGIDKQHRGKIFDLFYRAESELTRETVGTGIGLALVNQLVRSMDGRVELINQQPGAEFCVFLKTD